MTPLSTVSKSFTLKEGNGNDRANRPGNKDYKYTNKQNNGSDTVGKTENYQPTLAVLWTVNFLCTSCYEDIY